MKKLEKEMQELKKGIYSQTRVTAVKPKKAMNKAALDFLKLKDIPDKSKGCCAEYVYEDGIPSSTESRFDVRLPILLISQTGIN
ncbi:MAG: hypothetical protein WA144_11395 [Candidatus Methanoperedens sp.]